MCDGTLADVLYRTNRMPKGMWLSWQHKTTQGRRQQDGVPKSGGWEFKHVDGYDNDEDKAVALAKGTTL